MGLGLTDAAVSRVHLPTRDAYAGAPLNTWSVKHGPYGERDTVKAASRDDAALAWARQRNPAALPPVHLGRGQYQLRVSLAGQEFPGDTIRVYTPRSTEGRGADERTAVLALARRHARFGGWAVREFPLSDASHPGAHVGRADLALFSGATATGYEIKTARDTLGHFPRQRPLYEHLFDACHLAVTARHLEEARALTPLFWGLILLSETHEVERVVRAARPRQGRLSLAHLLWALWSEDLLILVNRFYGRLPAKRTREALIGLLLRAPEAQVREAAFERLRDRGGRRVQAWQVVAS